MGTFLVKLCLLSRIPDDVKSVNDGRKNNYSSFFGPCLIADFLDFQNIVMENMMSNTS